jgi:ApbE superfamily uncharacterized protein (UPF0280 family)
MATTMFSVKIIGHLKEPMFMPFDSPERVSHVETDLIVEVDGLAGLKDMVNAHFIHIMRTNMGMIVRKNPKAMMSAVFVPDEQYFVPINMISHITTETHRIVGQMPDETKKGTQVQ